MSRKKTEKFSETWFFMWILNNQVVMAFLILLLIGLTVLIFTKISPIFSPVIQFLTIIMLPLVKNWFKSNHVYLAYLCYSCLTLSLGNFDGYS